MNEDRHINSVKLRRMAPYILAMVLFAAVVVPCLVWGPFGVASYITGRLNLESAMNGYILLVAALGLFALISVLVLVVVVFLYWRKGARRALQGVLLLGAALSAFVASFGVHSAQILGPSSDMMFVRGLRQNMQHRADIAAIRDWLDTLNPEDYGASGTYSDHVFIDPPKRPECITHLRPRAVIVSNDGTGRLSVCLAWGKRWVGWWGLVVKREDTVKKPLSDPVRGAYELPISAGAYVYLTMSYP